MKHFTMKSPYEWAVAMFGALCGIITFSTNMLNIDFLWSWGMTLEKIGALAWAALVAGVGGFAAVVCKRVGEQYMDKWFGKKKKNDSL